MLVDYLPEALVLARAHRRGAQDVQPYELWTAANREHPRDADARAALYNHAMIEAGHLVRARSGNPFRTCPECGFELAPPVSIL